MRSPLLILPQARSLLRRKIFNLTSEEAIFNSSTLRGTEALQKTTIFKYLYTKKITQRVSRVLQKRIKKD